MPGRWISCTTRSSDHVALSGDLTPCDFLSNITCIGKLWISMIIHPDARFLFRNPFEAAETGAKSTLAN
jgi:hypothetical protein